MQQGTHTFERNRSPKPQWSTVFEIGEKPFKGPLQSILHTSKIRSGAMERDWGAMSWLVNGLGAHRQRSPKPWRLPCPSWLASAPNPRGRRYDSIRNSIAANEILTIAFATRDTHISEETETPNPSDHRQFFRLERNLEKFSLLNSKVDSGTKGSYALNGAWRASTIDVLRHLEGSLQDVVSDARPKQISRQEEMVPGLELL